MFKLAFYLAAFVAMMASLQVVVASPYFTSPIASTKANGDSKLQVKWTDNNKSPKLSANDWGNSTIWLAAGSESTQYKLQQIKADVSPSRKSVSFKIDKSIGPSGQYYFIRMEGSKTQSNGYPVMAFSARFTLNGMSGQFNSTVLQAAMGQEGPASGSSTSAGASRLTTSTSAAATAATSPSTQSASTKTSDAGRLNVVFSMASAGALALFGLCLVA